jgi:1-acyl-sn-glycerol-3-phosphate acyltransferase
MAGRANAAQRSHCLAMPGGKPCRFKASLGMPYCRQHLGPMKRTRKLTGREFVEEWRQNVERALSRRTSRAPLKGNYDDALLKALLPLAFPIYNWYWRVDVYGIENIPTEGPALLVSNHSGTLPLDGAMLKVAVLKEHGRNPWLLAADLVFRVPGLREITRIAGNARADREETLELLRKGELVGVFPEGFKGIGKGYKKRYQLQRFGRGGFVEMAMEVGCPIIPVAIVGAEETYPMIANVSSIANLFDLPYFPITPTFPLLGLLGVIPLPSKWVITIGEPVPTSQFGPESAEDTQLVLETSEGIRQTVQQMLIEALAKRRSAFF